MSGSLLSFTKRINPYYKYRLLEIIPGSLVWLTLIAVVLLSIIQPLWMIYFAILFDLYWLIRVLYFITYLAISWRIYRKQQHLPWMQLAQDQTGYQKIRHLIFLPTLNEDIEVVRQSLNGVIQSSFPKKQIVVVLAGEERTQDHFLPIAAQLQTEYADQLGGFLVTVHPADLPGEVAAKGANLHYAGTQAQKYVDSQGWKYSDVIVSAFDSDTVVHPEYFSCLTYTYLKHPRPTRSSFQPLALYNNNIWDTPSFARVVANSTTFWLMAELARPKPLWTFSSHSMSLQALVDVGFWQNDIVTEDSRIFLQCFIYYDGDYEVTPLYIPVSMDTAHAGNVWLTMKNLYKQQRRWAWGIEHFPFMIWHFWKSKLPRKKWHLVFNLAEGMYSWSSAPILILLLGYLPLHFITSADQATVLAQNAPYVLQWLMRIAMIGIFVTAILNVFLLPTDVKGHRLFKIFIMLVQWIVLPITLIIFGSIPAIDAQTRLLLGRYLGFYTTKKVR